MRALQRHPSYAALAYGLGTVILWFAIILSVMAWKTGLDSASGYLIAHPSQFFLAAVPGSVIVAMTAYWWHR